mgnify:CR=1 FL=1|jgi:hypothetical protein
MPQNQRVGVYQFSGLVSSVLFFVSYVRGHLITAHSYIFDFLTAHLMKLLNQYNSHKYIYIVMKGYITARWLLRLHLQQAKYFIEFDTMLKSIE